MRGACYLMQNWCPSPCLHPSYLLSLWNSLTEDASWTKLTGSQILTQRLNSFEGSDIAKSFLATSLNLNYPVSLRRSVVSGLITFFISDISLSLLLCVCLSVCLASNWLCPSFSPPNSLSVPSSLSLDLFICNIYLLIINLPIYSLCLPTLPVLSTA